MEEIVRSFKDRARQMLRGFLGYVSLSSTTLRTKNRQARHQTSLLLMLPAELRNRIYEMVLLRPEVINLVYLDPRRLKHLEHEVAQPSLTRTCHQIREETLPIFYGQNVFLTYAVTTNWSGASGAIPRGSKSWVNAIGRENRRALKHLYIDSTEDPDIKGFGKVQDEGIDMEMMKIEGIMLEMFLKISDTFSYRRVVHVTFRAETGEMAR